MSGVLVDTGGLKTGDNAREGLIRTIIERAVGTKDFVKLTKSIIDRALRNDVRLRFTVNRLFCVSNNRCNDAVDVFKTSVFNYLRVNCSLSINNNDYIIIAVGSNGEVDTYAFIARTDSPRLSSACHNYKLARRASYLLDTSEEFRTAVQEFTKVLAQSTYLNLPRGFTGEGEEIVGEDVLFKTAKDRFGFEPELLYLGAVEEFIRDLRSVDFSRLPAGAVAALQLLLNSLIGDTDIRRVARVVDVREGFIVYALVPWYTRLTTCFIKHCLGGGGE